MMPSAGASAQPIREAQAQPEPTQTQMPENQHVQVPSQTNVTVRQTSEQAIPYALPRQLWTTPWVPQRSSNFISLEDSIDAAIWDEATDGLNNVPILVISGLSVEHLEQKLLSEVKEAAKDHNFTKLLSKNRKFNMYMVFW